MFDRASVAARLPRLERLAMAFRGESQNWNTRDSPLSLEERFGYINAMAEAATCLERAHTWLGEAMRRTERTAEPPG